MNFKIFSFIFQHPKLEGIKVYETESNYLMIDFDLIYHGDSKITIEYNGIRAGIGHVQFSGKFRIIIKNIQLELMKVEEVEIMFLELPEYNYELLNAFAPLELFASGELIHSIINDLINTKIVYPNKIVITL